MKGIELFISKNWKVIKILGIFLFIAPLFIHVRTTFRSYSPIYFALPHICTGDEPHYLVMTSSIIKDFDLDVANNYENARRYGMNDLGKMGKYQAIDHHTLFFNPKSRKIFLWSSIFNFEWGKTNLLPPKASYPRHPEKENIELTNFREYVCHSIGLPLFLSLFLWPFRYFEYSNLYDSFGIFVMLIVALVGVFFFYKLLHEFYPKNAKLFTLIFAFGTPFWWYARSIYPDLLLCSLLLSALYFFLIKKYYLVSGFLMGFSILVKIQFLPIVVAFILYIVLNKKWRKLRVFLVPIIFFICIQLLYNYLVLKTPFLSPLTFATLSTVSPQFSVLNFLKRILPHFKMMLFSPTEGLLTFSPFLVLSFLGFQHFITQKRNIAFFIISLLATYFGFHLIIPYWMGGFQYGSRHLLLIIPLLFFTLSHWYNSNNYKILNRVFIGLVFISVVINLQGVFMYGAACHNPPWFLIEFVFKKLI
jgi:hypothetical protein